MKKKKLFLGEKEVEGDIGVEGIEAAPRKKSFVLPSIFIPSPLLEEEILKRQKENERRLLRR